MDSFRSSSGPSPDTEVIASSTEHPPFDSLEERNPLRRKRKVYAQRKPLSGLANIRLPGTLHWAVEVITESEIAEDDSGYIWDLAQEKGKIMINTSLWIGADSTRGNLLGYTNLTDREICDHASHILRSMNTNSFNFLDKGMRLYSRPLGAAHSLTKSDSTEVKAYDILIRNCQDFAMRLKESICVQDTKQDKKKRRIFKKAGKVLKVVFVGKTKGFAKLGTGLIKRAVTSSLSNPQFIQPFPGR